MGESYMDSEPPIRRSLLFVPGDSERKLDRADSAGADTLILDLEDAVAPAQKERARSEVSDRIGSGFFVDSEVAVRINPVETEFFEADLAAVVSAGASLLLIPKTESAEGIAAVAHAIGQHEPSGPVRLLALVETALLIGFAIPKKGPNLAVIQDVLDVYVSEIHSDGYSRSWRCLLCRENTKSNRTGDL